MVGDKVYIAQGEENLDRKSAGSLVCIKAGGTGDTTEKNEVWRVSKVLASKSSPLVVDGRVYCADDSGNLYIADAETGKLIGNKPVKLIGTIVRASPLYADGKIYLCSTTAWHVMQPTKDGVKFLDKMRMPERDEVSGSLAVSHGKLYLPTARRTLLLRQERRETGRRFTSSRAAGRNARGLRRSGRLGCRSCRLSCC